MLSDDADKHLPTQLAIYAIKLSMKHSETMCQTAQVTLEAGQMNYPVVPPIGQRSFVPRFILDERSRRSQ